MTEHTFPLKLLASDKVFFSGECSSLIIPSADGQYGILAKHSNVIIAVVPGMAEMTVAGKKTILFVSSGMAKVEDGRVIVLVESCENAKDINEAWAKNALSEAQKERERRESYFNVLSAEVKIARAINRLKTKKHLN